MKKIFGTCLLLLLNILLIDSEFQTSIFAEINKKFVGKNLIISPLSIYQILSLTTNGAKGKTQKEMISALEGESISEINEVNYDILDLFKDFSTVEIANAVMSIFTPIDDFEEVAKKYLASVEPLKSVEQVNNWCSEKTHGKIKEILKELDPDIVMILINAVYFKGEWSIKFNSEDTTEKPFYNFNKEDNEVEVKTMRKTNHFNYYEDDTIQAIELSYRDDEMSALIILPSEDTDINDYIQELNQKKLTGIEKKLSYSKVYLELPKFEVEFSSELKKVLNNLGMKTAFESDANFTGIREEGEMWIDEVIHKTYLKVTEDGTEAAAVTAITMAGGAAPGGRTEKIYNMKVNRPFLFMLKNSAFPEGYNMLFMSKIEEINKN